ncbi:MAG: dienelactone hydrolase family protein [Candidatus Binatia bacterium]
MRNPINFLVLLFFAIHSYAEASLVSYQFGGEKGQALICRPEGKGPFPAVVYNHGRIVDMEGYDGASKRGYDLDEFCRALAKDGFLALAPIRDSGRGNIPGHKKEISRAVDYVKTLPDVDPTRVALMGFSRGGLLTLMVGVERNDLKALLILAPAPGRGRFAEAVQRVASLNSPVLLLVEAGDRSLILEDFEMLERALRANGKECRAIRYDRGGGHRLFWNVGYYWKDVSSFLREKLDGAHLR